MEVEKQIKTIIFQKTKRFGVNHFLLSSLKIDQKN